MLVWLLFSAAVHSAHLRVGDTDMLPFDAQGRAAPFPGFHFMSFGDEKFTDAVNRIRTQAELTGLFRKENIHVFREVPPEIWNQPQWEWHRTQERGHGYWFWKSAIIRRLFDTTVPEGGVLLYSDAGCEFGRSETALEVWGQLMDAMKSNDLVVFGLGHTERRFTKGDIFKNFKAKVSDGQYGETAIIAATYFLIKNTAPARAFLEEWGSLVSKRRLVSDDPSRAANWVATASTGGHGFYGNRHDQSLFSMLVKANAPHVTRCAQKAPPFPLDGIRNTVHSIGDLRVELLPDIGYPPNPCNPISATRSGDATPRLGATCNVTKCKAQGVRCLLGLEGANLIRLTKTR